MAIGKGRNVNRQIVGFTKSRKILFFTIKPRPIYRNIGEAEIAPKAAKAKAEKSTAAKNTKIKEKLAPALAEIGIKLSVDQYLAACKKKAEVIAVAVAIGSLVAILAIGITKLIILAPFAAVIAYMMSYNALSMQPISGVQAASKNVENEILFAARDMVVSMRSGLPLFNAMATVSVGYGAASKEFEKIIDRVQLGMPMDQAIEEVSSKSQSPTFKRLMLQASTSIKVGSDVVGAIQEVINDVSQERIIELRRYGQRLNAIAMFYMLFGVIFPSMGLAVASIMSTFISIFPVNNSTLIMAAFGLGFLQFVFLRMVSTSRPAFAT
jgi:flagellar protein FlaJ